LLQIDRQDLANERLEAARDEVRTSLRDAQIGYTGLAGTANSIQVRIRDQGQIEAAKSALERLAQPISTGMFMSGSVTEMEMT
ncbi:MAG: hypothetical protein E5X53_37340, partial [Mesorhizobium sp.]|uniref:hypothetical protein n=1 Tax=Mesorhizobium sp. TaxID=1871066 RepID=UPI0012292B1A